MENYPSNSHKTREQNTDKKVEKVVSGKTSTKKKSGIRKLSDTFLSEDIGNVKNYIFAEVLLPAAKKLVSDIVTNGTNMLLYGEIKNKKGNSSKVSYSRYYDDRSRDYRTSSIRSGFDFDEIIFETRGDAEAVLDAMYDILNQYKVVSVAELYDLASITTHNYTCNNYGWVDLRGSKCCSGARRLYFKITKSVIDRLRKEIIMKTYVLEYIVYTRIVDGMLVSERKQKEVCSKTLQGAIKRLYLESEKNFGGLTAILKEG